MTKKADEIFNNSFQTSFDAEKRHTAAMAELEQTQRDQVKVIKNEIETIISQIPSVFKVENIRFDTVAKFEVIIPSGNPKDKSSENYWEVGMYPHGRKNTPTYQISLRHAPHWDANEEITAYEIPQGRAIEIIASELGKILGREYEWLVQQGRVID